MLFPLQDQGLGGATQGGAFEQCGDDCLLYGVERSLTGHFGTAEAGNPESVALEVALAEVAVATSDTVDGEVFTYLEIGRIVAGGRNGLAIQLVEHPVMMLQVLLNERGGTAAGAEQEQGEQQ